jgi:hypothetical protein
VIAGLFEYLARHTRPQFHRAVLLIVAWPFFLLLIYGLGWVIIGIHWLAGERASSRFPVIVLMSGLLIVGEWVRAIVKLWLRKSPDQRSIVATAATGAVVGASFDACMIIMWGNDGWRELLLSAAIAAAAYVAIDACLLWEERRKTRG